MRNLLAAIVVLAISATACSNPRTLRFTETNQAEVLAAVEKSKRIPEDEKQLLREHVANVAIAQAAVGALANMAAMLGGQKTPASPISPPLTLVGKTVDEAIADARRLKQAEVARKGEEERERQERKHEFEAYLPKLELRDITFTIGGGNRFDPERHSKRRRTCSTPRAAPSRRTSAIR